MSPEGVSRSRPTQDSSRFLKEMTTTERWKSRTRPWNSCSMRWKRTASKIAWIRLESGLKRTLD